MKQLAAAIAAILLLPVWSFAGKDFATVTGTVQDSAGRLMTGALVNVTAVREGLDRLAFTDSRGVFSFENLLPGEYLVYVTMPRFSPSHKEKVRLDGGGKAEIKFTLISVAEVIQRATSYDAKQDIVWTLRSSRATQSVLRFTDSPAPPVFSGIFPDYSGYIQFYSKGDPGAPTAALSRGSRFAVTMALPNNGKVTVSGQYNESPWEPKGASAVYEFEPLDGHQTRIGMDVRQGVILDDVFSAEELKQFQVSYADKFHLTETLQAEQGAEFGHAEGRANTNYFRPRGSLSWVPDRNTVIYGAFSTQAPTRADDPIRGREYFEQVNLPPWFEHYLHTEVGASRFIDEVTKVSAAAFQDRANYRALFVTAPDGRHGLLIFDGKANPSQGVRLFVNREFNGFETGLGYTVATGPGFPSTASTLEEVRNNITNRQFHVVTARVKTDLQLTNTQFIAVYRWVSDYSAAAIDPYQQTAEYNDPTLSISITQNLPTFGAIPARVQAIFDARNLLEQPFGSSRNQFVTSPRYVRGGINIRF